MRSSAVTIVPARQIGVALLGSMLLPWWRVTPVRFDGVLIAPAYSTGIHGVGGGVTDADIAVLLGPPIVLVIVLLAAWLSRRGLIVLALIGFVCTGTIGAFGLIDQSNFGLIGSFPTHPDLGLQLFAWLETSAIASQVRSRSAVMPLPPCSKSWL